MQKVRDFVIDWHMPIRWLISKLMRHVKSFDIDGIQVHVLPASAPFDDDQALANLTDVEKFHAGSIKAPLRRQEYVRSRWLVREITGIDEILRKHPDGDPAWPEGWRGSITHKDGIAAVAVIPSERRSSIGIDLERADRVGSHLTRKILVESECVILNQIFAANLSVGEESGKKSDEVLAVASPNQAIAGHGILGAAFSMKESLFKSHFPLGRTFFYFHDAEITGAERSRKGGSMTGIVKVPTTPGNPAGSQWGGAFANIEIDDKPFVLSCVQTHVGE